jgi:chromosome segregation ATPase
MCAAAVEGLEKAATDAGGDRREFLQKVGARNSAADTDRIQKAHDLMADLGAACTHGDDEANKSAAATLQKAVTDLEAANAALVKVADERDTLTKAHADLVAERDGLQKRHDELTVERDALKKTVDEQVVKIEKLSAEPAPAKGALKAIDKSHDLVSTALADDSDVTPILKADGTVDEAATAIKKARRAGGVAVRPL